MTKATGIGRGGRRTGGRPASGLTSAMVGIRISGLRMQRYKNHLGGGEKEVVEWLRRIFYGYLAGLDETIEEEKKNGNFLQASPKPREPYIVIDDNGEEVVIDF